MRKTMNDCLCVASAILLFAILFYVHINITQQFSLPFIFGERDNAILDMWSFQHLASGVIIGSLMIRVFNRKLSNTKFFVIVFLLSLGWEAVELSMEYGCWGQAVAYWKKGYEHWGNRFFGDIPLVVIGSVLATKFPNLWKIVVLPALVWLAINVISPNSMSVQQMLLKEIYSLFR